jgi:PAS domain S-box-containing protein
MHEPREPVQAALFDEDAEDLYEHAPCGYLSLLPDGTIGRINATFLAWTGFSRDALLGRVRFLDLLTLGGRVYYETHFQPLLRMQGAVREIAFDLVRADGHRLPVLVNAAQHEYPGVGPITRVTLFDATDRRRYERELLAARGRAEDAARARSDLVAMISHDVRAPLTAIVTAAALLEKTSTPQQAKYIRVLQSSAAHALDLVASVLDLARLDAGGAPLRDRDFSPRELIDEIIAAARTAAAPKPELEIRSDVDPHLPDRLRGDRPKIGQVLANLMMNAVKFTDRGVVSLVVTAHAADDEDTVTVEFIVSDTGIGIPADRLPHIFEEFTQVSDEIAERYGGTGLGLAISRKLLQLHGAALDVTSTLGQGTTFSFRLTLKRAG